MLRCAEAAMPRFAIVVVLGALVLALAGPAAADSARPTNVVARDTQDMAAQSARPHITVRPRATEPGPNSKRYCRAWLAQEYRVSGTVVVPRMQCWWQ